MYKLNKKTLTYDRISYKSYLTVAFVVLGIFSSIGFKAGVIYKETEKVPVVIEQELDAFSPEKLYNYIKELNIRFPDIVYKQTLLESNHFKSLVFKENNNMFGMRISKTRPTTHISENLNHASYKHWKDCVVDYALWQASYTRKINTEEQYYQFLDEVYCDYTINGKTYSQHLKDFK
jgi:hypothetical protein